MAKSASGAPFDHDDDDDDFTEDAVIYDYTQRKGKALDKVSNDRIVPELFFISALIGINDYRPQRYGIQDGWFVTHRRIHEFCASYAAGRPIAPTVEMLHRKFGGKFNYVPNVDPEWAAGQVREAHASRVSRLGVARGLQHLSGDTPDVEAAVQVFSETARQASAVFRRRAPANMCDNDPDPEPDGKPIPVDQPLNQRISGARSVTSITGGITPGSLWYVAARLGVGKSWRLADMALNAAQSGVRVSYYSLEMPRKQIKQRLHGLIASRGMTVDEWAAQFAGTVDIYDPHVTGPMTADTIAANHSPGGLAIVDYIGLMRSSTGARAVDDWRQAAAISNQLKEVALEGGIPIISAAQVNREGARVTSGPKAEHLAQSDALGQDADVLLMLIEHSTGTHLNTVVKNRHGTHGQRWYSRFDPSTGDFRYLTPEQASDIKARLDEQEEM